MGIGRRNAGMLAAVLAFAGYAFAQDDASPWPPVEEQQTAQAIAIETGLATLLQERQRATSPESELLDLRIDLRILQRDLLRIAADAGPDSVDGRLAMLRLPDLAILISAIDTIESLPDTRPAREARAALRAKSFRSHRNAADLLDDVGPLVLAAVGHPAAGRSLPSMRPAVSTTPSQAEPDVEPVPELTADDLAARTRSLSVTIELRAVLAELVDQARDDEAALDFARRAVPIAVAAAGNRTGLSPDERRQIESRLTSATLLFLDERLRDAGQRALSDLDAFAASAEAADDLGDTTGELASLVSAASRQPEWSAELLTAVDAYEREVRRHDQAIRRSVDLEPTWQRGVATLDELFARQRDKITLAASRFGRPGGSALFDSKPGDFTRWVIDLQQTNDVLVDAVDAGLGYARAEQTLAIRPTGGLERVLVRRLVVAGAVADSDQRADARDTLAAAAILVRSLDELPRLSQRLATVQGLDDLQLDRLPSRFNDALTNLGNGIASDALPGDQLRTTADDLAAYPRLVDAAEGASQVFVAADQADVLLPWADWAVTTEAMRAFFEPMRATFAAAVAVPGSETWQAFVDERTRLDPMATLLAEATSRVTQVSTFPTDPFLTAAARLEAGPAPASFEPVAFVSIALPLWVDIRDDPIADRELADVILQRLRTGELLPTDE